MSASALRPPGSGPAFTLSSKKGSDDEITMFKLRYKSGGVTFCLTHLHPEFSRYHHGKCFSPSAHACARLKRMASSRSKSELMGNFFLVIDHIFELIGDVDNP